MSLLGWTADVPAQPVKTLAELITHAKANPGKLSFSTTVAYGTMFGIRSIGLKPE